jgi:hypothetical protein
LEPPLSQWRDANLVPAMCVVAPASVAIGPASPEPDPVVHGLVP